MKTAHILAALAFAVAVVPGTTQAAAPEHTVVVTAKRLTMGEKIRMTLQDASARVKGRVAGTEPVQSGQRASRAPIDGARAS